MQKLLLDTSAEAVLVKMRQLLRRVQIEITTFDKSSLSPLRMASHSLLLLVVVAVLALAQIQPPAWQVSNSADILPDAAPTPATQVIARVAALGGPTVKASGPLVRSAVPFTTIPKRRRTDVINYQVQPGDTVFGIAEKFHLSPDSIMWSNPDLERNPDMLRVGDTLVILPVDGVYHTIKKNDTLARIAKKYKVGVDKIVDFEWNHLQNDETALTVGNHLIIPGGQKPYVVRTISIYNGPVPKNARSGSGAFVWPTSGTITQGYWNGHRAIDIGAWLGSPVVASDSGYVVFAGWDRSGYGNLIIMDHRNGYRTYYAHLSAMFVRVGDSVGRGVRIGSVGSTGHSTGPHLHFEIRYRNVQRNPLGFLH